MKISSMVDFLAYGFIFQRGLHGDKTVGKIPTKEKKIKTTTTTTKQSFPVAPNWKWDEEHTMIKTNFAYESTYTRRTNIKQDCNRRTAFERGLTIFKKKTLALVLILKQRDVNFLKQTILNIFGML